MKQRIIILVIVALAAASVLACGTAVGVPLNMGEGYHTPTPCSQ